MLNGIFLMTYFFEKQIINLANDTNCIGECIAKPSGCVRTKVKTKQKWYEHKCRCECLETNFTSSEIFKWDISVYKCISGYNYDAFSLESLP